MMMTLKNSEVQTREIELEDGSQQSDDCDVEMGSMKLYGSHNLSGDDISEKLAAPDEVSLRNPSDYGDLQSS